MYVCNASDVLCVIVTLHSQIDAMHPFVGLSLSWDSLVATVASITCTVCHAAWPFVLLVSDRCVGVCVCVGISLLPVCVG